MQPDICDSERPSHICEGCEADTSKTFFDILNTISSETLSKEFYFDYALQQEIAKGAFGAIYELLDLRDNQKFAGKFVASGEGDLHIEQFVLKLLENDAGFPKIKEILSTKTFDILIMSLLGKNLQDLLSECGGRFSLKTTLMIGMQAIQRLEILHENGFLHRDIKPENFVIGTDGENASIIHLIDFGLSNSYRDKYENHIPFSRDSEIKGNLSYLTIFGHLGIEASRRDDLISLGYMLLHLYKGELPWVIKVEEDFKENIQNIYKKKATTPVEKLCEGLSEEFVEYFKYLLELAFFKKPDYVYLIKLFQKIMKKNKLENDHLFDWNKKNENNIKGINLKSIKIILRDPKEYIKSYAEEKIE